MRFILVLEMVKEVLFVIFRIIVMVLFVLIFIIKLGVILGRIELILIVNLNLEIF